MDSLNGQNLMKRNGQYLSANAAIGSSYIICYYFSAHWCPPCRGFTPILADFYNDLKEQDASIEVVFVSSDRSQNDMISYMNESHGDWLAVQWNSQLANYLKGKYGVSGIPALIVVKNDGTIITRDGRSAVTNKGMAVYNEWITR